LTTLSTKRRRCSKRECRWKKPSTGMSCRRSSSTSLFMPGDSPSAPRSPSFTRNGGKRNKVKTDPPCLAPCPLPGSNFQSSEPMATTAPGQLPQRQVTARPCSLSLVRRPSPAVTFQTYFIRYALGDLNIGRLSLQRSF